MLEIEGLEINKGELEDEDELDTELAGAVVEKATDEDLEKRRKEAEAIYGSAEDVNEPVGKEKWEDYFAEAETFTITQITGGVRDPNRANIFLDGHFAFSLDVTQVIDLGVKKGQKVDQERLKELQSASEFGKLYQRTLEWVMMRPHSIRETERYLKQRRFRRKMANRARERDGKKVLPEIREDTIKLVVERLTEKKYLDDYRFAKYFVENRYLRKGISPRRLRMELIQKGVEDDAINRAMNEVERPEEDEILKVIRKKRRKYDDFQLVGYLMRQGFDFQKAKEAVANYDPSQDEVVW